jgi:hypothetical protein
VVIRRVLIVRRGKRWPEPTGLCHERTHVSCPLGYTGPQVRQERIRRPAAHYHDAIWGDVGHEECHRRPGPYRMGTDFLRSVSEVQRRLHCACKSQSVYCRFLGEVILPSSGVRVEECVDFFVDCILMKEFQMFFCQGRISDWWGIQLFPSTECRADVRMEAVGVVCEMKWAASSSAPE